MPLTNGDVLTLHAALDELASLPLPATLALRLARVRRLVAAEHGAVEAARMAVVRHHAIPGDDGEPTVADGVYVMRDRAVFDAEWRALLDAPSDVTFAPVADAAELAAVEGLRVTARAVDAMIAWGVLRDTVTEG